jgi:hypothetical protein
VDTVQAVPPLVTQPEKVTSVTLPGTPGEPDSAVFSRATVELSQVTVDTTPLPTTVSTGLVEDTPWKLVSLAYLPPSHTPDLFGAVLHSTAAEAVAPAKAAMARAAMAARPRIFRYFIFPPSAPLGRLVRYLLHRS